MLEAITDYPAFIANGFELNPWIGYLTVVLVGLSVGSFLNVVIYRMVKEIESPQPSNRPLLSLLWGRSHCGHCHAQLKWYDMIPVFSWLWYRGQCRVCATQFSAQYPVIEALTGALFVLIAWRFGWTMDAVGLMFMSSLLVALAMIDLRTFYLPDDLNQLLLWSGLVFAFMGWGGVSLHASVMAAVSAWAFLWSINWAYRLWRGHDGLGAGDFTLFAGIGAWLGYVDLPWVLLWSAACSIVAIPVMRRLHHVWGVHDDTNPAGAFPLGPGLALGGVLVVFGLTFA